jgi:hypothetical protein
MQKLQITKTQEKALKKILKTKSTYSGMVLVKNGVLHATDIHRALSFKVEGLADGTYKIDGLYVTPTEAGSLPDIDKVVFGEDRTVIKVVSLVDAVTLYTKETGDGLNFKYLADIGQPFDKCDLYFNEKATLGPIQVKVFDVLWTIMPSLGPIQVKVFDVLWTIMPCKTKEYNLLKGNVEKELLGG